MDRSFAPPKDKLRLSAYVFKYPKEFWLQAVGGIVYNTIIVFGAIFLGKTIDAANLVYSGEASLSLFYVNLFAFVAFTAIFQLARYYKRYYMRVITNLMNCDIRAGLLESLFDMPMAELNHEKVKLTEPKEKWDYLGISFDNDRIGLSPATLKKIKGKIRRKARSIYRWKIRKKADDKKAMSVFARAINKKLYGKDNEDKFTWTRWFFPLITVDQDLKIIDAHVQQYMRYVSRGRFSKGNYGIRYCDLKDCGYRNLVNAYHRNKRQKPCRGPLPGS